MKRKPALRSGTRTAVQANRMPAWCWRTGLHLTGGAILKRIAHNLLRQDRSFKVGIANKRLAAAWNKDYLCRLIGLKSKPV